MYAVVDENVPIVANDSSRPDCLAPQANEACRRACIQELKKLVQNGVVVLDDAGEILKKYRNNLSGTGQPGVGDAFLKHLFDNQYNQNKVLRKHLAVHANGNYTDFPNDRRLKGFDHSDRIFVALAKITKRSVLLNAVDSDYSIFDQALSARGIRIRELCPDCLKATK